MTRFVVHALVAVGILNSPAWAEPLSIKAIMSPKEQIRADLPTGQPHFVLLVRREGRASGTGVLHGAELTEYGMHDIRPGVDGTPRGYLVAKLSNGDQAVIQWEGQATFIPGPDGKPRLLDNLVWRLIGGTGNLAGIKGAGIMHIKAVSPQDREFLLDGEAVIVRK
jgi:hypothetical protein